LNNLAWACFECNTCKAGDIASYDTETGELTPFYNPRAHTWDEHFAMDGPTIIGKTPIGRVTIHILQMNVFDHVEMRRYLIEADLW
jgi:hypothetical protein